MDLAATVAAASSGAHFYGDWDDLGIVKMQFSFLGSFESSLPPPFLLSNGSGMPAVLLFG